MLHKFRYHYRRLDGRGGIGYIMASSSKDVKALAKARHGYIEVYDVRFVC